MTIEIVIKTLMVSPLLFGVAGLLLGTLSGSPYTGGLVWMGVCFGAFIGACAAMGCLISERFRFGPLAAFCINTVIFLVVGREMLIL